MNLVAAAWLAWFTLGAVGVMALAMPSVRLPSDDLGLRRFQTPELASGIRLSQTFQMTADGFHAIELSAAAVGTPVIGTIRLELHDLTGHGDALLGAADVSASDLVRAPSYRFEFLPIPTSKNTPYRVDVVSSDTQNAEGVALWATKGERYAGGAMLINDIPRWADLAFKTYAPAPSRWRALMNMPSPRRQIVVTAIGANWILLGLIVGALSRMSA